MISRAIVILLSLLAHTAAADVIFPTRDLLLNHQLYHLEVAQTHKQRRQGLMYRKSIARDGGMLFVYDQSGNYRIWMKNTLIPLTVIWLDEQARITAIKLLQPCHQIHCPVYGVTTPTRYILELHSDRRLDFKSGQQLTDLLRAQGLQDESTQGIKR